MSLDKQYDKIATNFSESVSLSLISRNTFYKILGTKIKRKKLLDIGCGEGTDLLYYKNLGAQVSGVDASKDMIALAQSKLPQSVLEFGNFENLPFKSKSFDIVVSKYALQTSENLEQALLELFRVAKKGAIVLYLVVHPLRQFLEKKSKFKDYYKQENVSSVLFKGSIVVTEPSHMFSEYFSPEVLKHGKLISITEGSDFSDTGAQQVKGDYYPTFMICKFIKI
jgi:ubiquinone/menaquinone biosynthesis C-methylase UbiE